MITRFASNVVLSKARAMFGKRLSKKDYEALLACSSVADILVYLRNQTKYSEILSEIKQKDIHRRHIETILRQQLFYDFIKLCHYELSVGELFSNYLIQRIEIEHTLHFLALFEAERTKEYIYSLPAYFDSLTKIDIHALVDVKSYDDILKAYEHTEYYDVFLKNRPEEGKNLNLSVIENELLSILYKNVFATIKKHTGGKQKKELTTIFQSNIDLTNFVRILRLKKYFHLDLAEIEKNLLPYGSLTAKNIAALASAKDSAELFKIMQSTVAGRGISKMKYAFASEIIKVGNYSRSIKSLRFSIYPSVVMISYTMIQEIEITNIINIIEGIRYNVPADEIKKILVYS